MGFSRALLFCLVLTTTYVCTASLELYEPPPCDYTNLRVMNVDIERLQGTWYKKYTTGDRPDTANVTGFQYNIQSYINDDGEQRLHMDTVTTNSNYEDCDYLLLTCPLINSTCYADHAQHFFSIIAIDYDRILAAYTVTVIDGVIYPTFTITVREPTVVPDVTPIADAIRDFCGDRAVDVDSDFYSVKHSYNIDNFDKCFNS